MLAMHQDVQDKVIEEFNSVFYNAEEEIDNKKLTKLKYFDLVIKETLRLFPVAPVIGRKLTDDIKLDGWEKNIYKTMRTFNFFFFF